jgi:hypothetical protein
VKIISFIEKSGKVTKGSADLKIGYQKLQFRDIGIENRKKYKF